MTNPSASHDIFDPLLDVPPVAANAYGRLADCVKRLFDTTSDILFVQAEALLALEAAAASLARPGLAAVNVVTSPYGAYFGAWLRRGGAAVTDVVAEPGQPAEAAAVAAAITELGKVDLVAVVHAEAANGSLNPLDEVASLAREAGALLVVDAVASAGGHPLDIDALGIDLCVLGPQKALGGPTGLSMVAVSQRAFSAMADAARPAPSLLSLLDIKEAWLDRGRGALPGTPPPLEFRALGAALDRLEAEGLPARIARHQRAARASRAGLRALGVAPWIADDGRASALVTAAPVPEGIAADDLIDAAARFGVSLGRGFGDIEHRLVRFDHTGVRAAFPPVLANVVAYGAALEELGQRVDLGAAAAAVTAAWQKEG
ncbi:aminotransferase class V-fold PLP-dependent enzyme [Kaistia geumhonensis]|uniref:Aspartate aminotransferase-like enzyme n=1 Tax=Kaistia geumhonensis TaxID=410839 RepID=A0ABU0M6H0_9HYPH|nr:aminotransferase class V-fold PLP-dependent enzyme [Kaistia geumhonensis]MCX5478394.1 aminotransferase class V-fold PLP-dependent enzyme [Kaistia geumhonensis]MDQ0516388.1 aspartate aminotransferase-like enzyme [Kaistia geumhonensis]